MFILCAYSENNRNQTAFCITSNILPPSHLMVLCGYFKQRTKFWALNNGMIVLKLQYINIFISIFFKCFRCRVQFGDQCIDSCDFTYFKTV